MTDKYILNDILETEKNMAVNLAISLNEASCDNIYTLYYEMFQNISNEAKTLFNIAYNKNWYTLDKATKTKINENYSKLKSDLKN